MLFDLKNSIHRSYTFTENMKNSLCDVLSGLKTCIAQCAVTVTQTFEVKFFFFRFSSKYLFLCYESAKVLYIYTVFRNQIKKKV